MLPVSDLAAVPWWTAAFAIITAADVAIWIYALRLLPPSQRNTTLKAVSFGWLVIPIAAVCVFAARDILVQRISFDTAAFAHTPEAAAVTAHIMTQPQWKIGPNLIGWIPIYGDYGFGLLALLAVFWVPKGRISQHVRTAMGFVPFMFLMCSALMLSG